MDMSEPSPNRSPFHPITLSPHHPRRRRGKTVRNLVLVLGLAIFSVWTLFPFLWIISTSIKPEVGRLSRDLDA
jgi:hypothetical protein